MSMEMMRRAFEAQRFVTHDGAAPFDLLAESEWVFVAVKQYASVDEMLEHWAPLQAHLAAEFYGPDRLQDEKLWDSYLVLVCPGLTHMDFETARKVDRVLGNMAYCRKMLIDLSDLQDIERVRRKLAPLFAVGPVGGPDGFDPLAELRRKLAAQGVTEDLLSLLSETELERLIQRAKAGAQA